MQSRNRKLKRVMQGLQNPDSNSSKVAQGGKRLQVIDLSVKQVRSKRRYLTATGIRARLDGAAEKELSKHRKYRYSTELTGKSVLNLFITRISVAGPDRVVHG